MTLPFQKKKEYFKGINLKANEVIKTSESELFVPAGFTKQLNRVEKTVLINDQLMQYDLMLEL